MLIIKQKLYLTELGMDARRVRPYIYRCRNETFWFLRDNIFRSIKRLKLVFLLCWTRLLQLIRYSITAAATILHNTVHHEGTFTDSLK